jgi:two-component system sensor histidine kinase AtoS
MANLAEALAEVKASQRRIVQAERLAAVGELVAGVAHELKNPVTALSFAAENLRRVLERELPAGFDRAAIERYLGVIGADIGRLRSRLDQFISLARGRPRTLRPVRLDETTRAAVRSLGPRALSCNIAIEERYPERVPEMSVDQEEVYQAISNLLVNAVEACGPGSRVLAEVAVAGGGRMVEVSVEDNGPGIPPDDLDRIFDVFFTTKENGTGLGLPQVFVCAERHGGTVEVQARPGRTRFTLRLPVV